MRKAPITYDRARKKYVLRFERGGKRHNLGAHEERIELERTYAAWMAHHHLEISNQWYDIEAELTEEIDQKDGEARDTSTLGDIYWDQEENMFVKDRE